MSDTKACAGENMFSVQLVHSIDCFTLIKRKIENSCNSRSTTVVAGYHQIVAWS
jgi:hypothetical protein